MPSKEKPVPVAPEPISPERLVSLFVEYLKHGISANQAGIARFEASFKKDPVYALEWAGSTYEAVAVIHVNEQLLQVLTCEKPLTLAQVGAMATKECVDRTRSPSQSSSVSQNLMRQYIASAWAQAAAEISKWTA